MDYFGWADPRFYLGDRYIWVTATSYSNSHDFLKRNRTDGWIAVSATFFQQATSSNVDHPGPLQYLWLKGYKPEAVIGNSIFVWHITR
mgnify:FL=1